MSLPIISVIHEMFGKYFRIR